MPNAGSPFCVWAASTAARYTAPGRSVPLNPHTALGVSGSMSIVSDP
jgi:hypothetical protein